MHTHTHTHPTPCKMLDSQPCSITEKHLSSSSWGSDWHTQEVFRMCTERVVCLRVVRGQLSFSSACRPSFSHLVHCSVVLQHPLAARHLVFAPLTWLSGFPSERFPQGDAATATTAAWGCSLGVKGVIMHCDLHAWKPPSPDRGPTPSRTVWQHVSQSGMKKTHHTKKKAFNQQSPHGVSQGTSHTGSISVWEKMQCCNGKGIRPGYSKTLFQSWSAYLLTLGSYESPPLLGCEVPIAKPDGGQLNIKVLAALTLEMVHWDCERSPFKTKQKTLEFDTSEYVIWVSTFLMYFF